MNLDPCAEEINGQHFSVEKINEDVKKDSPSSSFLFENQLTISECKNITKQDEFGLSLEVKIKDTQYFLKLPPGPDKTITDLTVKAAKDHYSEMRKRLEDEFKKSPIFEYILSRCTGAMFTIARPIAFCVSQMIFHNESIDLPGLIYQHVKGDDLSKNKEWYKNPTDKSFLQFAKGLTRAVQLIHYQGVLHSFLVPRNIIKLEQDQYTIVGFGYSSFCDSRHYAPTHRVSDTDRCYRAPECAERENLGALWFPVDIYSIGAILYQLATGNVPNSDDDPLPRDVNRLKEHIYDKLADRQNNYQTSSVLFTNNENILKILDRCLRHKPEDRFSCAEELIEALEIAEQATGKSAGLDNPDDAKHGNGDGIYKLLIDSATAEPVSVTNLADPTANTPILAHSNILNHLFNSLLKGWSVKAVEDAERMQRGHYEIYGHRDLLVTSLCRLLAGAQAGNTYRTMTLPSYWTDSNLGSNGRFLTMNKHMARMGLIIERIFLVNKSFHELTEREQEILEFQLEAERIVRKHLNHGNNFKVMVKELRNEDELTDFEKHGKLVAYLESEKIPEAVQPAPDKCLCLNFVSHGHYEWSNGRQMIEHSIKKVRYWIPNNAFRKEAFLKSHNEFADKWQNSISLEEYIGENASRTLEELLARGRQFVQTHPSRRLREIA